LNLETRIINSEKEIYTSFIKMNNKGLDSKFIRGKLSKTIRTSDT